MPIPPFTQRWADAFCAAVNADERYAEAARGWRWPVAFVLDRVPEHGYPEDVAVELTLEGGRCTGAQAMRLADVTAPFRFRGDYRAWKRISRGELDPVNAVMKRELAFSGAITTLMLHTGWARALVACVRSVDSAYPDEE